jgi:orotidine-5'-phosphate decarboxylase
MPSNPCIIALDLPSAAEALQLVDALGDAQSFYKVGLELHTAAGSEILHELRRRGKDIFLDLKFYDIPETVKRATASAAQLGARFLTVHASAAVVRAAKQGAAGTNLEILAVTVLTAFDQSDLADLGHTRPLTELVEHLALKSRDAGTDGLVCSPLEVARLRSLVGPSMKLVTPGVRSAGADAGDQKRIATPAQAIADGASYLVIGRQVTRAANPAAELARILNELNPPSPTPLPTGA